MCASSEFKCSWCVQMNRCVNSRRNCPSDAVVTGTAVRSFYSYTNELIERCFLLSINLQYSFNLPLHLQSAIVPAATKTLIHAFISSRLDYCNQLLVGVSARLLDKLQSLQNAAARLVTGTRKLDHITPVLREIHWLPVRQRVKFRTAVLVPGGLLSAGDCHCRPYPSAFCQHSTASCSTNKHRLRR